MSGKKRVLFVDDEPLVLQGLQRLLRSMRGEWDMVFADSGPRGLEALAQAPFDVVVSDIRMAGMDGAEFIHQVMSLYPNTIRLVLSGHADQDLILRAEGAAHQFLTKPCDPELLISVIRSASEVSGRLGHRDVGAVLGRIAHLPVIPATYQTIVELLESETTTVEDLGKVVQRDPGLAANLLKLVNSAYFGLRQRVADPAEAVSFLGVETLKGLALLHGVFQQAGTFPAGFNGGQLWRHSLDLAATAREIARKEGQDRSVQAECFTGGLLHDVGLLILASGFPEEYRQIVALLDEEPVAIIEAERRVIGVHHGEVGGYLLGLWGLPAPVVEAVRLHHGPPASTGNGFSPALVVLATEHLSSDHGDCRVFGLHRPVDPAGLEGIPPATLAGWQRILDGFLDTGGPA